MLAAIASNAIGGCTGSFTYILHSNFTGGQTQQRERRRFTRFGMHCLEQPNLPAADGRRWRDFIIRSPARFLQSPPTTLPSSAPPCASNATTKFEGPTPLQIMHE